MALTVCSIKSKVHQEKEGPSCTRLQRRSAGNTYHNLRANGQSAPKRHGINQLWYGGLYKLSQMDWMLRHRHVTFVFFFFCYYVRMLTQLVADSKSLEYCLAVLAVYHKQTCRNKRTSCCCYKRNSPAVNYSCPAITFHDHFCVVVTKLCGEDCLSEWYDTQNAVCSFRHLEFPGDA